MIVPLKSRFIQMTEEEFFIFCQEMSNFHIERNADGTILIMEPTGAETGSFDLEVGTELSNWNRSTRKGKAFGSSAGFTLPNNAVKSPDAAWIAIDRWKALPADDRKRFAHISPDFVVEIKSETDNINDLKQKMLEFQENGVRLGWLIDPGQEEVWIYRVNGTIDKVESFDIPLSGEDVLEGFELRLNEIWQPDED